MEKKIGEKVIFCDIWQDNSYVDNGIAEKYPEIHNLTKTGLNLGYFRANSAPEQYRSYYKADQMLENFLTGHGEIMAHQYTLGDGQYLDGELDQYQYGFIIEPPGMEGRGFEQYDHLAWTDVHEWILLTQCGLRGLENGNLGTWGGRLLVDSVEQNRSKNYEELNPDTGKMKKNYGGERFMGDMLAEFVARADWAANPFDACNHAPVLSAESLDLTASAGETVDLAVSITDPDGDDVAINWFVYNEASEYYGSEQGNLSVASEQETLNEASGQEVLFAASDQGDVTFYKSANTFTIPEDAATGDYFVVICRVQDLSDAPMTRNAEFVIEIQ